MRKECGFFVSPNLSLLFSCGSHILRVNNTLEKELKKLHPDDAPQSPDLEYACWGVGPRTPIPRTNLLRRGETLVSPPLRRVAEEATTICDPAQCWGVGTRTPIPRTKTWCPTIRRLP